MKPRLVLALAAALSAGCGAKTGLLVPDVPDDRLDADVVDVPDAPTMPPELCIDPDRQPGIPSVNLATRAQLFVADVFFLIDRTGSMDGEIDNIKANLQASIVPQIARAIGDVEFGVATYGDFPILMYGDGGDIPFTLVAPIDRSVANVQGALNSVTAGGGGDNAEAMMEALYQVATGEGYLPWIPARSPCAGPGRSGYACFRREAQPIIVLVTDAPSHNGPPTGRGAPYLDSAFTNPVSCPASLPACRAARGPHTWAETVSALTRLNARVIGVNSGTASLSGQPDLEQIARATGAVTASGGALVITIRSDGADLDARVVSAVQTFTRQVRFNASARVLDRDPMRPATRVVAGVRPVSANPSTSVQRIDATTFYGVVPGTELTFAVELVTPVVRTSVEQRYPARVQFLGDGRPNLGYRDVDIVIPPANVPCDADAGATLDAAVD